MWALIMTVYLGGGVIGADSRAHASFETAIIKDFKTEQACRYAGAQQEVALRNDLRIDTSKKYTFICVKGE